LVQSLTDVMVECVKCGREVKTDFDSIEQRKMLKCVSCGTSFHINDVYDMYYDEEPLVKNAIDLITRYANQPWTVANGKVGNSEKVTAFLKKIGFDSLLGRILNDIVKYGDSFLEIIRDPSKNIIELRPFEAKLISFKLGKEIQYGRAFTGEREVEEFTVSNGKSERRLKPTEVVHSKNTTAYLLYAPYGEAVMRISLNSIHSLRITRDNAIRLGQKWWVDHLENEICVGIGVPRILLERNYAKNYPKPVLDIVSTVLLGSVREAQEPIEESFQSQLFGQLLGEKDLREIPRLEFKKPNSATIMKNGGYDFAVEIASLKEALRLNIITREEYERILNEYLRKS